MSSILTNASAMVALQTLKSINSNLNMTQNEISTGKSVGSAKDNSAVWAISKVMESDVQGFKAISDSLSLGGSSIAVARSAAETVTDLLTKIKSKVVAAQEENVDRTKIQDDITALTNQIKSVTGAAQFNGLNLVKGQSDVNVLSSLDRSSDGSVKSSQITVARQDLTSDAGSYNAAGTAITGTATASAAAAVNTPITEILTVAGTIAINDKFDFKIGDKTVSFTTATTTAADVASGLTAAINAAGIEGITAAVTGAAITLSSTLAFDDTALTFTTTGTGTYTGNAAIEARAETVTFSATAGVNEGDGYRVAIGGTNYDDIAGKGETFEDVARGLKTAIDAAGSATIATEVGKNSAGAWQLKVDNSSTTLAFSVAARAGGTATGGLFGLDSIDVTSTTKAAPARSNIETMIGSAIDAATSLGSAQGRIETQSSFVSKLSDSLKIGIGSMVDANLEEASARLQALQVQQQLATQSLSIANQAPQSILSLFR